tara:strand:+ start:798 stop:1934 length:1137 start_codon:yes stop_codon:yes gene_type:complete
MSEIKVNSIKGVAASAAAITVNNTDGTCSAKLTDNGGNQFANRNKIINGEFRVNQRNHSGSASHNSYTLDRWKYARSANTEFSTTQSTDTPDGFANSVKLDCISANGSTGSTDYAYFRYHIEGQDLQDLNKGTSAAKVATLSFYVKCDITGTFAINVVDANNRMCNLTYTVSDTNWNRYILTIPADTSGAIANSNLTGLSIHFYIIAGSSITSGGSLNSWGAYNTGYLAQGHTANIVSTDHNWYMTGVQLEISDYATPFEHRSYAQELKLCERYFEIVSKDNAYIAIAMCYSSTVGTGVVQCRTTKRTSPSIYQVTGNNYYIFYRNNGNQTFDNFSGLAGIHRNGCAFYHNSLSHTQGHAGGFHGNHANALVALQAEL